MKSYLSLISISAKVHRRQNRMTRLCIVFAVFMVTAVFSMAEMGIRMEYTRLVGKHGDLSVGELFTSSMAQSLLPVAGVLFLLILTAGVLMISGSMNSTVAQRTEFFGMMRCIGMSRQQIVRFVRLEALNWCKTAIPIGLALGVVVTWGLCAVLRFLVGEEFSNIPLFGISIILFLSFSVMVEFVNYLMPQSVAASDIDIASENGNTIPCGLAASIRKMDGVKEVYGRRSAFNLPASIHADADLSDAVDLISYDDFDLQSLKKDGNLKKGSDLSKVYGDSSFVLATSDADSTWEIGDTVQLGGETLTIAGLLKNDPFSSDGLTNGKITLIASGDTFIRLTGEEDYALVMVQTTGDATDENVQAIRIAAGQTYRFTDRRGERTAGTYRAFVFCVYAFLAIIALVTVLNIVNSISMSVSARMKQYGAMRAVGMDERQVTGMIAAEAFTYAAWGCGVGCIAGLPLSGLLYEILIAGHFPYAVWRFPLGSLAIIVLFVLLAAVVAVYAPAKRICSMPVTATMNEL